MKNCSGSIRNPSRDIPSSSHRLNQLRHSVPTPCGLSPVVFDLHSEYFTKEALEVFGDF
jgi:hypothetical protein